MNKLNTYKNLCKCLMNTSATLLVESLAGTNFRGYKLLQTTKVKTAFPGHKLSQPCKISALYHQWFKS